jgi:tRNA threonylcarbamoyl adenosine modification protein YeaZ
MGEPLVLALDGSTRVCSTALLRRHRPLNAEPGPAPGAAWEVVDERVEVDSRGQAKVLLRMIDEMLESSGGGPPDLGAIVVGVGPGTFTGVRIAVATARALSLALGIPVVGISTLSALASAGAAVRREAAGLEWTPTLLVPVVDARRGQLFYGLYERVESGSEVDPGWRRTAPFAVCDRGALGTVVGGHTAEVVVVAEDEDLVGVPPLGAQVIGNAVQAARLVIGQKSLEEPENEPGGARLGGWLAHAVVGNVEVVPEEVKPIYVRSPDADIHITKMRDPWGESPAGPPSAGQR